MAATVAEAALVPIVDLDWSVRAGPLDWDVERTITHMIGAVAKYTLYLASRSDHFIALYQARWPDATNQEVLDSIAPLAAGLAEVAGSTPPQIRAYHATGPTDAIGFVGRACVELLAHADDVLAGFGIPFEPPAEICARAVAQQYPDQAAAAKIGDGWQSLLRATGRQAR